MTETPAPIEDRDANIRLTIQNIVSRHEDAMFAEFDQLHKHNIHDDDVKKALTELHYTDLADGYEDWMNDGEPVRADEDGPLEQGEHLVADPGDAPSYAALEQVIAAGGGLSYTKADIIHPMPSDRSSLQYEIDQLQKEYVGKFHTDPVFHAKAKLAANFLDQLESVQIGDSQHAGFLLAALLDKGVQA